MCMVKTTIDITDDIWRKFSIKVIEDHGGRKKNDVITALIGKYLEGEVSVDEAEIDKLLKKYLPKGEGKKK